VWSKSTRVNPSWKQSCRMLKRFRFVSQSIRILWTFREFPSITCAIGSPPKLPTEVRLCESTGLPFLRRQCCLWAPL
jgi:hypothetical protein